MKFFGKELPTDKINFVMNILSFVLSILFFMRMQSKMGAPTAPDNNNSERDSLIKIQTRVTTELKELKKFQDSITHFIRKKENLLNVQAKEVVVKRRQLYSTLSSDWEQISREEQTAYVNKIMYNLKSKK